MPHNSQPPLWAILLAAGRGQRLGGVCKALLEVQGQPLIARQLDAMFQAGVRHAIVVTGFQASRVKKALESTPNLLRQVTLTEVSSGQEPHDADIQHSVRCGLIALQDAAAQKPVDVVLSLIDLPLLQGQHVSQLVQFAKQHAADIVIPQSQDRQPGHPIFLSDAALNAIDLNEPQFSLRRWLGQSQHGLSMAHMPSHDPAYFTDVDTPEDLAAIAHRYGIELSVALNQKM